MKPEELLSNKDFALSNMHYSIFDAINEYLKEKKINQTDLAKELKISKGRMSQIINGKLNRLDKFVELAIKLGLYPEFKFTKIANLIADLNKKQEAIDYGVHVVDDEYIQEPSAKVVKFRLNETVESKQQTCC